MKIESLVVENFRAITKLELDGLGDTVVIAGPNGCGKSCALDAIRLLKSAYGGYGPNEWQSWFGEFNIDLNKHSTDLLRVFQDPHRELSIGMTVRLSHPEIEFLGANADQLLADKAWQEIDPNRRGRATASLASDQRTRQPAVDARVKEWMPVFLERLKCPTHSAQVTIKPGQRPVALQSSVLELVFSLYSPARVGIIDFHGANRNYNREQLSGINLNIQSSEERLRQHALYNSANKYQNLKSEMAAGYIRHLLAKEAQPTLPNDDNLTEILKELFATFFPGKEFLGPTPTADGSLLFPVQTSSGAVHDIDDLSSGEKEVLYGYLRLRNSAPRNSVIMIDEPELHLNPRLIDGLASFYHRHLGRSLNNQLWLVTHSDTLIREAVEQHGFSVFHLRSAEASGSRNQAVRVSAADELDRCVIDLVGDMAAYRPGAKLVLFEGGGDTDFDIRMTSTLFPEFAKEVNPISGGSKRRVSDLFDLLESARRAGHVPARVYMVTDSDGDVTHQQLPARWTWPAYHIENYLLEPFFILRVLDEVASRRTRLRTEADIELALKESAGETIPELVAHELRKMCNAKIVPCIDFSFDPSRKDVDAALREALTRSHARIEQAITIDLDAVTLRRRSTDVAAAAHESLRADEWRLRFRGRDVLKRFVAKSGAGLSYNAFRDLVLARMAEADFRPIGMARVIQRILLD